MSRPRVTLFPAWLAACDPSALRTLAAALCCVLWLVAASSAAPPQWKYLFPAGAQRGTTVDIEAHGKFDIWPVNVWIDRPGLTLVPKETKGTFTAMVDAGVIPGVFWFRLFDAEGATPAIPFIVNTLPEVTEEEPNNAPGKPQTLPSANVLVNGRLQKKGDVDTYALRLEAGETLVAEIEAHRTLGAPVDTILEVVSTDGFVLARNDDDQELDPRLVFVAPQAGVYLVRTFGFPAVPNSTIDLVGGETLAYRLTLTTAGYVDFTLPLAAGPETQRLHVEGWNLPAEARDLAPLIVREANQATISHPQLANTLTLPIVPHPSIVALETTASQQPQHIDLPVTVTGCLGTPRRKDRFAFAAKAGQTIDFRIESRRLGYPLDPVLELFDSQAKLLNRVDDMGDNRDGQFAFAVPADGEYQLTVSDLHRHGGPRYVYRLTGTFAQPDFKLSLASDLFSTTVGQQLEIPVSIERWQGFSQPIHLRIVALPDSATVAEATSLAEGDSAKSVKLVVSAGSVPYSGPIEILGTTPDTTPGTEPVRRIADAPITGRTQRISKVWLTISAAKAN